MLNDDMKWETIELLGYTYFAKRQYRVLIPLVKSHGYDFVIEKDGLFLRVNTKVAGLKSKRRPKEWSVSVCRDYIYPVDIYLVWMPHISQFIELPGDFFSGVVSKSRHIPRNLWDKEDGATSV